MINLLIGNFVMNKEGSKHLDPLVNLNITMKKRHRDIISYWAADAIGSTKHHL